jgi:hypothetical protein
MRVVMRPVELLGAKGLPGYVVMVLAVLALDFVPHFPRHDGGLLVVVAVCALAEWAALTITSRRRARGGTVRPGALTTAGAG